MSDDRLLEELEETLGTASPKTRAPRRTREQDTRPKVWQPASALPEPDRQPGYDYRWVRVATLGQADARNISSKMREGWEPVRVEEQPQYEAFLDRESRFKDNIEIGGLMLCKAPKELMDQRREYFAGKNQSQMESVDNNFMRENDQRMPLFREKKSTTSFGRG